MAIIAYELCGFGRESKLIMVYSGADEDEDNEETSGRPKIPCSFPDCERMTTWDATYEDLCYEHIRADNE